MKKLLLVLFVVIVSVAVFAASKPDDFRYERSIEINAPATRIFPLINNLRANRVWSPWEKMDPAMKRTYSGEFAGKGAKYAWDGNEKIGAGSMEITESVAPTKVVSRLEFTRPMAAVNTTEFTLDEKNGKTTVTWAMYGRNNFIGKLVSVFMDCEKMVTEQFDAGLAEMKKSVENQAALPPGWAVKQRERMNAIARGEKTTPTVESGPTKTETQRESPVESKMKKKSAKD